MKKIVAFILLAWLSWAGVSFSLHFGVRGMQDKGFKDIYGASMDFLGGSLSVNLKKGFYLYGGYDAMDKEGKTLIFSEPSKTTHHYLSLGAGLEKAILTSLYFRAQGGLVWLSYREEALGEKVENSCVGFEIGAALRFYLKRIFLEGGAGYIMGKDEIEGEEVDLNGLKYFVGAGLKF